MTHITNITNLFSRPPQGSISILISFYSKTLVTSFIKFFNITAHGWLLSKVGVSIDKYLKIGHLDKKTGWSSINEGVDLQTYVT